MKALIVYYSRTGVTRRLAHHIGEALEGQHCDVEQILDLKARSGLLGRLVSGKDAIIGKPARIEAPQKFPSDYDVMLIGTPVWVGTPAPAVRSYLGRVGTVSPKVAFFCTMLGAGGKRAFRKLRKLTGAEPITELAITGRRVKADDMSDQIAEFVAKIAAACEDQD